MPRLSRRTQRVDASLRRRLTALVERIGAAARDIGKYEESARRTALLARADALVGHLGEYERRLTAGLHARRGSYVPAMASRACSSIAGT